MNVVFTAIDHIESFFFKLAQIVLVVMMLFSALDTILRYVYASPIMGGYEILAEYMMPFMFYLAVSYVFKRGGHVRVSILTNYFSKNVQAVIKTIMNCLSIVLFCLLTYATYIKTIEAFITGEYSANFYAYKMWPAFTIMVVGFGILVIRLIVTVIKREDPYGGTE